MQCRPNLEKKKTTTTTKNSDEYRRNLLEQQWEEVEPWRCVSTNWISCCAVGSTPLCAFFCSAAQLYLFFRCPFVVCLFVFVFEAHKHKKKKKKKKKKRGEWTVGRPLCVWWWSRCNKQLLLLLLLPLIFPFFSLFFLLLGGGGRTYTHTDTQTRPHAAAQ